MDLTAWLVTAVLALGIATVVAGGAVRIVPAGHVGVVSRAGRVTRWRSSGVVLLVPVVDSCALVRVDRQAMDPLVVLAVTRDGIEVRLVLSVLWRVSDPVLAVDTSRSPRTAAAQAVERALHHRVAHTDLVPLLRDREAVLAGLPAATVPLVDDIGVEIVDADLLDADVRAGPELLRLIA